MTKLGAVVRRCVQRRYGEIENQKLKIKNWDATFFSLIPACPYAGMPSLTRCVMNLPIFFSIEAAQGKLGRSSKENWGKLGRYPFFNFPMKKIGVWWAKSAKISTTKLIYYTDFATPYGRIKYRGCLRKRTQRIQESIPTQGRDENERDQIKM